MSNCRIPSLVLALILAASAMLRAQAPTKATTQAPTKSTAPATPPAGLTIQGHIFSSEGNRVSGAAVTIAGPSTFVEITESGTDPGHYSSPALQPGNYQVTVNKEGYRSQPANSVTLDKDSRVVDFVLDPACGSKGPCEVTNGLTWYFWGTLGVVLLFIASIWVVRWHNIARPNREMLRAEIDNTRARFKNEVGSAVAGEPLEALLTNAEDAIKWGWWRTSCDFLFWSRGQEITGWSRINEFRRGAIRLLSAADSLDMIRARLQTVELYLVDSDKTHAKTLAGKIKDALEATPPTPPGALQALLVEALTYQNDQDVNTFAQLVGWQTKAAWLAGVGCTLIVVLSFAVGNPVLFIAGAAGGYLSRLARALKRADVPTDYGASWTTLFLCPVVGALSGWFGILLIVVLADSKLNVLGTAFQSVKWCCAMAPIPLGLAFVLGFSERLFDGIISTLEDKVDSDRKAATQPQQPTSSASAPAAPPPPGPGAEVAPAAPSPAPGANVAATPASPGPGASAAATPALPGQGADVAAPPAPPGPGPKLAPAAPSPAPGANAAPAQPGKAADPAAADQAARARQASETADETGADT
jgi:hypothetical protein